MKFLPSLKPNPLAASFNNTFFILLWSVWFLGGCAQETAPTFASDIAPIIHQNCVTCHRPQGGGPFSLISYNDVAKRSKMVAHVTQIRYMPPWPADPNYSAFLNQKMLSNEQIYLIQKWHKAGAPLGDTTVYQKQLSLLTQHQEKRSPDWVVELQPIQIRGNHLDRFYVSKNPIELPNDTFVKMIEFIPGLPGTVHHVNGHVLNYPDSYPIDLFQGRTLVDVESNKFDKEFMEMNLDTEGETPPKRIHSAVNYLPGVRGVFYPKGIGGFKLNKRAIFVFKDLHYGPSDTDAIDHSQLHIYFTKKPPKRPVHETMLGTNGISPIDPPLIIPPDSIKTFYTRAFIGEQDISLLTINPHMHLLGKSFKAYATKPNGDTIPLIHIPKWDFRWQYYYTFPTMIKIPRGSYIVVEATYDNTSNNPNNPNKPPIRVSERLTLGGASMRTTDEMLQFIISYLPYQEGDEHISLEPDA